MIWKPNVTVAALVEREGRFLLVEEHTAQGLRINQPAGHLEEGESLITACQREALEETGWRITPTALVGLYQWRCPDNDVTYLRVAFAARAEVLADNYTLDEGIVRALWLDAAQIEACRAQHRSPLVARCVADYLAGRRVPLDFIDTLTP